MSTPQSRGAAIGAVLLLASTIAGCFHPFECEDADGIGCHSGERLLDSTGEACVGEVCSNGGSDEISNTNAPPPELGIAQ